jgi:tetratricopeptide (TPR) repeat protein
MQRIFQSAFLLLLALASFGQAQHEAEFDKGVALMKSENYKEAIKKFSAIIPQATQKELKKYCYIYRSFCYNGLSEFKKSIADLDTAISIDPDDIASYVDRGKTKGYMNDMEGSKKDFKYVLTKDSTTRQGLAALYYLGLIAFNQNEDRESVKYYDRYLALVPDDAEVYYNRGCAKGLLLVDLEGSIKDYDKAIQLKPNYAAAYANRGVAKINLFTTRGTIQPSKEQTKDACEDLKKAKALGDNTVDDMIYVYCDKK